MKIDRVIISSNDNPDYLEFVKIVGPAWKKLTGITPDLIYVSNKSEEEYSWMKEYVNVHQVEDKPNIPSANQAQASRMMFATLCGQDVCMLSDLDMLPLSGDYFNSIVEPVHEDKIAFVGGNAYTEQYMSPICYMVAKGDTFAEIINPGKLPYNDLLDSYVVYKGSKPPCSIVYPSTGPENRFCDESLFSDFLKKWTFKDSRTLEVGRKWDRSTNIAVGRIDRANWEESLKILDDGKCIDAHMVRPLSKNISKIKPLTDYLGIEL